MIFHYYDYCKTTIIIKKSGRRNYVSCLTKYVRHDLNISCKFQPSNDMSRMGPADVGPKKTSKSVAPDQQKPVTKDIWDTEEVAEGAEYEDIHDTRPQPE